ncbi:unnamed protein product, partial [marine sediment metagenome]
MASKIPVRLANSLARNHLEKIFKLGTKTPPTP